MIHRYETSYWRQFDRLYNRLSAIKAKKKISDSAPYFPDFPASLTFKEAEEEEPEEAKTEEHPLLNKPTTN